MAPPPRLRILSVGSNGISAFLAWRLGATTSCDVTIVWKSGFESVSQFGVSMKSKSLGNERFRPRHVVRSPEEASSRENAYDYVILCVKALPDVYDLAAVIESVVTPQHTCILVNTTNTLGVESHLEQRFPTNVILSLVSGIEINQLGASEFEHVGPSTDVWVGATTKTSSIPSAIQNDMAAALAMTLESGAVDCKVSNNIRQEQFERMIGPIAFDPASVLFDTPNHAQLLEKVGVREMVSDVIDELITLAQAQGCSFASDFRQRTIEKMVALDSQTTMYEDFQARRPMEVETYLGSPIKLATESNVRIPRIETSYALLHHTNTVNLNRPKQGESPPPSLSQPPPRMSSAPPQRPPVNGAVNGPTNGNLRSSRTPSGVMMPGPRRGPPPGMMPRPPSAQPHPAAGRIPKEPSLDNMQEFNHVLLYEQLQDGPNGVSDMPPELNGAPPSSADLALRERELALRQREVSVREQEMRMRGPPPPRRAQRSTFDEEDDEDFFDPMESLPAPQVDPDQVDMMSITSRKARRAPGNPRDIRRNPEGSMNSRPGSSFSRYFPGRRKAPSDRVMQEIPGLHDSLMENPMMGYSSNRYGAVDRKQMHSDSRANSLTASRMGDYPPHPYPQSRRNSQSPAAPFPPRMGRPMEYGLAPPNGPHGGHPSPPGNMRAPVPRYPPGHGNAVGPQQVEQYGVSHLQPANRAPKHRSLTGSASASAESGDSGVSANIDYGNSTDSSQISLGPQGPMPMR